MAKIIQNAVSFFGSLYCSLWLLTNSNKNICLGGYLDNAVYHIAVKPEHLEFKLRATIGSVMYLNAQRTFWNNFGLKVTSLINLT